ncbi:MAG: DUF664 domain-containing protein [Actinomyces sp.]|nr:DUF664 domain-containing protein [Actinomyces sp.]MDO4242405.1 DUF664 domain-containing protein [Actinomyces sp.]
MRHRRRSQGGTPDRRCAAPLAARPGSWPRARQRAAGARLREYLSGLEPAALDEVVDRSWDPPVTRGVRIASIIDDAAQHSGQAVWARRLLGLTG